jgi:hypothetical protein
VLGGFMTIHGPANRPPHDERSAAARTLSTKMQEWMLRAEKANLHAARRCAKRSGGQTWRRGTTGRAYEAFLVNIAVPMFKQAQAVLKAEGYLFTVQTPRRASASAEKSAETYLELISTRRHATGGTRRASLTRGRRGQVIEESPVAAGKAIATYGRRRLDVFCSPESGGWSSSLIARPYERVDGSSLTPRSRESTWRVAHPAVAAASRCRLASPTVSRQAEHSDDPITGDRWSRSCRENTVCGSAQRVVDRAQAPHGTSAAQPSDEFGHVCAPKEIPESVRSASGERRGSAFVVKRGSPAHDIATEHATDRCHCASLPTA